MISIGQQWEGALFGRGSSTLNKMIIFQPPRTAGTRKVTVRLYLIEVLPEREGATLKKSISKGSLMTILTNRLSISG
jgi:hypothetical protein